jgi:hypothetical protein
MLAMATHVVFKFFSGVSQVFQTYIASVSIVFGRMLQMFSLDVAKVDLALHMLQWDPSQQPPVAAAGPACTHVGVEEARVGYHAGTDKTERSGTQSGVRLGPSVGHEVARASMWLREAA